MIISASRRTDIPACHAEWLFERIEAGFVPVQNPFNPRHIREVDLSPSAVDGIVFWTKNPGPMMGNLDALDDYAYYFQFTLNAYLQDMEVNLPPKPRLRETFMRLSDKIGPERVIWRYDPVLLTDTYTVSYHIDHFGETAERLRGYTKRVVFSFIDFYKRIDRAVQRFGIRGADDGEKDVMAAEFAAIARQNGLSIETCAEDIDLSRHGISHGHCVDEALISALRGYSLNVGKDKNQRPQCGCASSVDIGAYHSCQNGCVYCYA
ncbi:MAG: DUF1848 domain-containing protein [Spirochaetaceae bacterium]|jgi:hypothetical protein|nr:DUF1848 domain-containing protein [Spirochaetaceae bacterium]